MTLAVRAVAELFQALRCSIEINCEILALSVSQNHRSVRIHGHYPVFDGFKISYHRNTIHGHSLIVLDGDIWAVYRFILGIYKTQMPNHLKRPCEAIDSLTLKRQFVLDHGSVLS
jgi:hypothetical protein